MFGNSLNHNIAPSGKSRIDSRDDSGAAGSVVMGVVAGLVLALPAACNQIAASKKEETPPGGHTKVEAERLEKVALPKFTESIFTVEGDAPFALSAEIPIINKKIIYPNSSRTVEYRDKVVVKAEHEGKDLSVYDLEDGRIDEETGLPYVTATVYAHKIVIDLNILHGMAWIEDRKEDGAEVQTTDAPTITVREGVKTAVFNGFAENATNSFAAACNTAARLFGNEELAKKCEDAAVIRRMNEDIDAAALAKSQDMIMYTVRNKCMPKYDREYKKLITEAIIDMVAKQRGLTHEQAKRLVSVKFVDENGNGTNAPFNYKATPYDNDPNLIRVYELADIETSTKELETTCTADLPNDTATSTTTSAPTDSNNQASTINTQGTYGYE